MNVSMLRFILAGFPDDAPVLVETDTGGYLSRNVSVREIVSGEFHEGIDAGTRVAVIS